jgi:hypothetical protein
MKNAPVRMSQTVTECFVATVDWNKQPTEVLFVPLWGGKRGFVGPGYWEPMNVHAGSVPPPFKYNTRVYTREELIAAGAKPKMEFLWTR